MDATAPSQPSRLTVLLGSSTASDTVDHVIESLLTGAGPMARIGGTAGWPFLRHVTPQDDAARPHRLFIESLADAFPSGQAGGTRLLTTQATYQLQRWLDWLAQAPDVTVVADLSAASRDLGREALARRGPWARIQVVPVASQAPAPWPGPGDELSAAFRHSDPRGRLEACARACRQRPDEPGTAVALSSAAMEVGELEQAHEALAQALALDDTWEAPYFELGKLWLRADDTQRAADAFRAATERMPTLAVAHSNLGAALAELDHAEEALVALDRAARLDPFGPTVHNNLGAALRDLGRLAEAEDAFRRVIHLHPAFVFGHYNLGHTLFLAGRFAESRRAYERGLELDPVGVPQQRARLALACAAAGDATTAMTQAMTAIADAREEQRSDIRAEMLDVLGALATTSGPTREVVETLATVLRSQAGENSGPLK